LQAAFEVSKLEGIIPALETAHAFANLTLLSLSIREGDQATENALNNIADSSSVEKIRQAMFNKDSQVIICLSGRGDKDLSTYMNIMNNG
jgi:tryptophan synthase beta chain